VDECKPLDIGTVLVGAAQPFFQCTPTLLSATWFGKDERALVGRCRLTVSNPELKPRLVEALETRVS
jgi:hypothetical protein